jgi:hypothetical protein
MSKKREIYLNSKSGVAIIAPGTEKVDTGAPNDTSGYTSPDPLFSAITHRPGFLRVVRGLASTALAAVCRWPWFARQVNVVPENRIADDLLLRLTQGVVSTDDEITFLDASCSRGELLAVLGARTKWKLFDLAADPVAAAEALSKGCQEATLRKALGIRKCPGIRCCHLGNGQLFRAARQLKLAILLNPGAPVLSTPNLIRNSENCSAPPVHIGDRKSIVSFTA